MYVKTILDHVDSMKKTSESLTIPTIIDTYLCSLFHRIASISLLNLALKAKVVPLSSPFYNQTYYTRWETTNQYVRRVYRDDIVNAAVYLDPAIYPMYDICGHDLNHAIAFYVRLLKGCVVHNELPQLELAKEHGKSMPQLKTQFLKDKSIIIKRSKPWSVTGTQFDDKKKEDLQRLVSEFRAKGLTLEGEDCSLPEARDEKTTEQLIQDQINSELVAYKVIMHTLLDRNKDHFGKDVFENNCNERYTFWPTHEKKLPLLYLCAVMLLGTTLTAMENERFHSSVAFIHSKLRSSLSVASVERLTLCKVYLAEALQAQDFNLSNDVQVMEAMDDNDCNDALTS